jgi:hypothetical protein
MMVLAVGGGTLWIVFPGIIALGKKLHRPRKSASRKKQK